MNSSGHLSTASIIQDVTFFYFYQFPRHPPPMRFPLPEKKWFLDFWLCNRYTIQDIRCIRLSFHIPPAIASMFPHRVHSLSLRRHHPDQPFTFEFYHYIDTSNRLRVLPIEQQYNDFHAVEQWMMESVVFQSLFHQRIVFPEWMHSLNGQLLTTTTT